MKVIFVRSGNVGENIITTIQGESLLKQGIEINYFNIIGNGVLGYFSNIPVLYRYIKNRQPDILHAHYGLSGWIAYLAKPKKLPMVLSYMGSDILPSRKSKISLIKLLAHINLILQNRVDHVLVKSENLKNLLSRKAGVSVIANGVDLKKFIPIEKTKCREKLGFAIDKKIVLFLGNPKDNNKNFQLVEKAANFIGDLDLLLLKPFPITQERVPIYLNAADVLIVSSIFEGSPNVIKEAMACNCPIVATDVGDIRLVFGNTEGCFLTAFSTVDMANKIKNALNLNKRTNGRKRIMELGLDSNSVATKIIEIYKSIIKD